MHADRLAIIEEVFHKARMLAPGARAAYLDDSCSGDLDLRQEVESLLTHAEGHTAAVDLRAAVDATEVSLVDRGPVSEGPGSRIGPYKILEQIGEGGFGVVYMAEQQEPVTRKVALKIIKLGMDTKQVIARFEAERQALAMMDHPNIARVLDAGATDTGRPYFVMELVRGIPVTEFCDSRRLSPRDRLDLFVAVCHAIQHAHQKGVIHRDIKPSNVLVTLHDDRPVPKIIDFGIAKATAHRLTEKTLFTEFRQFVGTPEYMSPDQAEISGLDVDTRTDIYSLGVLLYELLTGTTPIDVLTLRTCGYAEMQRIIREVEPPMPSTRVGSLERTARSRDGGEPPAVATEAPTLEASRAARTPHVPATPAGKEASIERIADFRQLAPDGLRRMLRGELDWIVMKAIEKDRTRRYQTANELADDIGRFLSDEPVTAGPPSTWYRLRKFARRHRVGLGAVAVIAAALLVGAALAASGLVRASREAAHSREVNAFLQTSIIHAGDARDALTLDEVVERGRELFGDDHAVVGTLLSARASALGTAGRQEEAIAAQREALAFLRKAHPGDDASVAAATSALAEMLEQRRDMVEAEALYTDALAMRSRLHGDEDVMTADTLEALTSMLVESGSDARYDEIRVLWPRTVAAYETALGPDHPKTVKQLCTMATWLHSHGFSDDAAPLLETAVERARRVLAMDDLTRFLALNAWGQALLLRNQDFDRGVAVIVELIEMADRMWGRDHAASLSLRGQLVAFRRAGGDEAGAIEALEEFLSAREASGPRAAVALPMIEQQALLAMRTWLEANPDAGRKLFLFLVEDASAVIAEDSPERLELLWDAGGWMVDHGYDEDAAQLLGERLALLRSTGTDEDGEPALTLIYLGETLVRLGRPAEAEPLLRESLELREDAAGTDPWLVASVKCGLGRCLAQQERYAEAEPLLVEGCMIVRASPGAPDARRQIVQAWVVDLYERWGRPDDAAAWRGASETPEEGSVP